MKRIFTFAIALLSMFAMQQTASALVYNVTVPVGTFECYIAGAMNGWSQQKMDKVDATHFTITIATSTEADKYKYCSGPKWDFEEYNGSGATISDRTYSTADVVLEWKAIYNPTVVPVAKDILFEVMVADSIKVCYIAGSFDGWKGPVAANQMTRGTASGGTVVYSLTVHTADSATTEFKFCAGPDWAYEMSDPSANFKYAVDGSTVIVNTFKKMFDPAKAGTITVTATVPAGTAEVWAVGSFQAWSMDNAVACTKNTDGTFSFSVNLVETFSYKLFNKKDASWGFYAVDAAGVAIPDAVVNFPTDVNATVTVVAWKQDLSAINEVKAATNLIYTESSSIVVEGVISQVAVFDLGGRRIQSENMAGKFKSNALKAGMYIVRVDGATRKMGVK